MSTAFSTSLSTSTSIPALPSGIPSASHCGPDPEAEQMRIYGLASWLNRHAPSLYTALEAVAGDEGADLLCRLVEELSERHPNPIQVLALASRVRDLLAEASVARLYEIAARPGGRSHHARVNWLGARLTDLIGPA